MGLNGKRIRKFYESKKQAPSSKYTEWKEGRDTEKQIKQEAKQEAKKVYKKERASFLKSEATRKAKTKARKGGIIKRILLKNGDKRKTIRVKPRKKVKTRTTSRGEPRSENGWTAFGGANNDWASLGGSDWTNGDRGRDNWTDYSPKKIKTLSTKKKKRSDIFDLP